MLIRDVMLPEPTSIRSDRTIRDGLGALDATPTRRLPVLEDGALFGTLSDRSRTPWRAAPLQAQRSLLGASAVRPSTPTPPALFHPAHPGP